MNPVNIIHIVVLFIAIFTSCRAQEIENLGQSDLSEIPSFDHEVNYTWTIENWYSRRKELGALNSPLFAADTYKNFKWFISLKFRENHAIDAFLTADGKNEEKTINSRFSISFFNQKGEIGHGLRTSHIFRVGPRMSNPLGDNWGWVNFVYLTEDFEEEFVSDNTVRVFLQLEFTVEDDQTFSGEDTGDLEQNLSPLNGSQTDDKNGQMLEFLLLQNHGCADAIIVASNKEYPVHKAILAAKSKVFDKILETTKPSKPGEPIRIDIGNSSKQEVMEVLKHIYIGKSKPTVETAEAIIRIAGKFKIEGLKNHTVQILSKELTLKNTVKTFEIANKVQNEKLKTKVIEFVLNKSIKEPNVLCKICEADECTKDSLKPVKQKD